MDQSPDGLYIDGEIHKHDDLTFGERRLMDRTLREMNADLIERDDDGNIVRDWDPGDATIDDLLIAFVYVIKRRTNPEFSMDEVLKLKQSDLRPPNPKSNGGGKRARSRPTKAATSAA